jgi:hypothetical protein
MPRSVNQKRQVRFRRLPAALLVLTFLVIATAAQEFPKKIRGYKVHTAEIAAGSDGMSAEDRSSVAFRFGEPEFETVGIDGVTFRLPGKIQASGKSGKVDFIAFKDFTVNGIPVDVREYTAGFEFRNGEETDLPEPVEITVSIPSAIRGAAKEINESQEEWEVAGRLFVFGKFRKFGFSFKRVVPIDVVFKVPNPLR